MSPARVEFTNISHSYGKRVVLRDISLTLDEQRIGIIGANGSGKSTLARMINGLVTPDTGGVHVLGQDVARNARAVRRQVGFMFTDPDAQIVMPLVGEDMAFSLRSAKLPHNEVQRRVEALAVRFGLQDHLEHPAHDLSGGQKQLLALCSLLIREPKIVVCDEPTTLLDARNTRRVAAALAELEQQVIVLTHDLSLLANFDRVILLDGGQVVGDGAPGTVIEQYLRLLDEQP